MERYPPVQGEGTAERQHQHQVVPGEEDDSYTPAPVSDRFKLLCSLRHRAKQWSQPKQASYLPANNCARLCLFLEARVLTFDPTTTTKATKHKAQPHSDSDNNSSTTGMTGRRRQFLVSPLLMFIHNSNMLKESQISSGPSPNSSSNIRSRSGSGGLPHHPPLDTSDDTVRLYPAMYTNTASSKQRRLDWLNSVRGLISTTDPVLHLKQQKPYFTALEGLGKESGPAIGHSGEPIPIPSSSYPAPKYARKIRPRLLAELSKHKTLQWLCTDTPTDAHRRQLEADAELKKKTVLQERFGDPPLGGGDAVLAEGNQKSFQQTSTFALDDEEPLLGATPTPLASEQHQPEGEEACRQQHPQQEQQHHGGEGVGDIGSDSSNFAGGGSSAAFTLTHVSATPVDHQNRQQDREHRDLAIIDVDADDTPVKVPQQFQQAPPPPPRAWTAPTVASMLGGGRPTTPPRAVGGANPNPLKQSKLPEHMIPPSHRGAPPPSPAPPTLLSKGPGYAPPPPHMVASSYNNPAAVSSGGSVFPQGDNNQIQPRQYGMPAGVASYGQQQQQQAPPTNMLYPGQGSGGFQPPRRGPRMGHSIAKPMVNPGGGEVVPPGGSGFQTGSGLAPVPRPDTFNNNSYNPAGGRNPVNAPAIGDVQLGVDTVNPRGNQGAGLGVDKVLKSVAGNNNKKPQSGKKKNGGGGGDDDDDDDDDAFGPELRDEDGSIPEKLRKCDPKLLTNLLREVVKIPGDVTWNDIAGLKHAQELVEETILWPLKNPELFEGKLRKPPGGLLLFGPPGTGKTMIAKAIANDAHCTFFSISASSMVSKWIGEGERLVKALFALASWKSPSVIFVDEIDSLLTSRTEGENDASRRIKTEFLVQMDGVGSKTQGERLLLIGATNRPQELDEAARRRMEERLYITLPNQEAREEVARKMIRGEKHSLKDSDFEMIAKATVGMSGCDVTGLCAAAGKQVLRDTREKHKKQHGTDDVGALCKEDLVLLKAVHFKKALLAAKPSVAPSELVHYEEWDASFGTFTNQLKARAALSDFEDSSSSSSDNEDDDRVPPPE